MIVDVSLSRQIFFESNSLIGAEPSHTPIFQRSDKRFSVTHKLGDQLWTILRKRLFNAGYKLLFGVGNVDDIGMGVYAGDVGGNHRLAHRCVFMEFVRVSVLIEI